MPSQAAYTRDLGRDRQLTACAGEGALLRLARDPQRSVGSREHRAEDVQAREGCDLGVPAGQLPAAVQLRLRHVEDLVLRWERGLLVWATAVRCQSVLQ